MTTLDPKKKLTSLSQKLGSIHKFVVCQGIGHTDTCNVLCPS